MKQVKKFVLKNFKLIEAAVFLMIAMFLLDLNVKEFFNFYIEKLKEMYDERSIFYSTGVGVSFLLIGIVVRIIWSYFLSWETKKKINKNIKKYGGHGGEEIPTKFLVRFLVIISIIFGIMILI